MASKRVLIFLVAAVVLLGAVFQVSAESISREYVIRQAGVEIGTTAVEISQAGIRLNYPPQLYIRRWDWKSTVSISSPDQIFRNSR